MSTNTAIEWIRNVLVQRLVDKMQLGDGSSVEKCEVTQLESNKDNWASVLFALKFTVRRADVKKDVDALVKLMVEDGAPRELFQLDGKFSNESFLYSSFVPAVISLIENAAVREKIEKLIPRCYYASFNGKSNPPAMNDGVIVMENLQTLGFKLGNRESLDFDHLSLAVECLGSFHAMSYFMKERRGKEFFEKFVPSILETMLIPSMRDHLEVGYGMPSQRALPELRKEVPENDEGFQRLSEAAKNAYAVMEESVRPEEPLAVICHGDYLRNNILFHYDAFGKPDAMRIVDFQTLRYASPAVDLSLLLYMNSTHELRVSHMNTLFRKYHRSVVQTLAGLLEEGEGEVEARYSFEAFLEDFRRHAWYGYFITLMFLPWMYASPEELAHGVQLWTKGEITQELINAAMVSGGDRATRAIAEVAKDFRDFMFV